MEITIFTHKSDSGINGLKAKNPDKTGYWFTVRKISCKKDKYKTELDGTEFVPQKLKITINIA